MAVVDDFVPYLLFKYRAQELRASLFSSGSPPRVGEGSRDLSACVDRLLDNSLADDDPYLL